MTTYIAWTTYNPQSAPRVLRVSATRSAAEAARPTLDDSSDIYAQTAARNFEVSSLTAFRRAVGRAVAETALERYADADAE